MCFNLTILLFVKNPCPVKTGDLCVSMLLLVCAGGNGIKLLDHDRFFIFVQLYRSVVCVSFRIFKSGKSACFTLLN